MPQASLPRLSRRLILASAVALAAGLSACSSGSRAVSQTQAGFGDAAMSPLTDLNLRREEIPPRLAAIVSPYEPLPSVSCVTIGVEVLELTNILGPDSDVPPGEDPSLNQQAADGAARLALNQVSSTMSDFIPFRSLVREATGASAHDRRLRAAFERGVQRRAYLKGVGAAMGCAPPAAPDPRAGLLATAAPIEIRNGPEQAASGPRSAAEIAPSPAPRHAPQTNQSPPSMALSQPPR